MASCERCRVNEPLVLIKNYRNENAFLLCQSPSDYNQKEFWSFIYEHHVVTIVTFTTNLEETKKVSDFAMLFQLTFDVSLLPVQYLFII